MFVFSFSIDFSFIEKKCQVNILRGIHRTFPVCPTRFMKRMSTPRS